MSTRTTNRRRRSDPVAGCAGAGARVRRCALAASERDGRAAPPTKTRRSRTRTPTTKDDEPEKTLPPVLQKALDEKEKRGHRRRGARRSGCSRTTCASQRARLPRKEQAEALYKLAELYWEESKAVYLEKMGRYQAAVTACHDGPRRLPAACRAGRPPSIWRARRRSTGASSTEYPQFRKIDTVIYLYAFSLRDQGKLGESIKYFQIILDRFPRSRFIADAWMAIAEYRFYEQQNYKTLARGLREGAEAPEVARSTTWRCSRPPGATGSWATPPRAALRFKDVLDLAKKKAGTHRGRAEARRGAAGRRRSTTWSSSSPRTTPRPPHDAFEFLAQIGGKAVLAQGPEAAGRHGLRSDALRARRRGLPPAHRARSQRRRRARLRRARSSSAYQLLGDTKTRRRRDAQAGRRLRRAQRLGQPPTRIARRPSQHARTMAEELIRNLAKTHARRGAAEREDDQGRRQGALRARRRGVRLLPGRTSPTRPTPPSCATCAPTSSTSSCGKYEEAGREYLAVGKTQPVGKYHKDALLQAMGAVREGPQAAVGRAAASARSPTAIACSARRPISTRRCSPRTRRSSPSSTRTVSSSSTTATTTRRSSASA